VSPAAGVNLSTPSARTTRNNHDHHEFARRSRPRRTTWPGTGGHQVQRLPLFSACRDRPAPRTRR
jgi:hypothetical protein